MPIGPLFVFSVTTTDSVKSAVPSNVTPGNSKLKNPEDRARYARVFNRTLTEAAGYVLPIQRWQSKARPERWRSELWRPRRGHLFLIPGDSPVGFRLPLGSLPYIPPNAYPYTYPTDPTVERGDLPDYLSEIEKQKSQE